MRNNLALMNQGRDRNPFRLIARYTDPMIFIHSNYIWIRITNIPEMTAVKPLSSLSMAQSNYIPVVMRVGYSPLSPNPHPNLK